MHAHRLTARLGALTVALGLLAASVRGEAAGPVREENDWPVVVRDVDANGRDVSWTGAGPLLFGRMADDGGRMSGLRPLWVQENDARGAFRAGYFLYPIFTYRTDGETYQWNVFELLRRTGRRSTAAAPASVYSPRSDFEFWPFIFWRKTGDPAMDYAGILPIGGTVKNKLGFDQATWVAFPLYMRTSKRGVVTTSAPWPFVRITSGAAHGFGLWPLFNVQTRPGAYRRESFLWPLGYNNTTNPAPDAAPGTPPRREIGALPFYARHTGPGYFDENYLWPFFGYTDETVPARYHETRYFWPFLVQGRGDGRYVNRWGPFYTHSVKSGYDKTWYAWPVVRHAEWSDRGLALTRTQVLYFLYWSERQRSEKNPRLPEAELTHVWPLLSTWSNGAGRSQWQLFSPLEVFFPGNEKVHAAWSPLFAVARHEQTAPGETRTSLLWNAVTWRHDDANRRSEFHLGPILSVDREADTRRIAVGNGLVAFRRNASGRWTILWLDFPAKPAPAAAPAR